MSSTSDAADPGSESTVDFVARLGGMVRDGQSEPLSALIALRARIDQATAELRHQAENPSSFPDALRTQTELPFLVSVDRLLVCRVNDDDLGYEEEALRAEAVAECLNRTTEAGRRFDGDKVDAGLAEAWRILNDAPESRPTE